MPTPENTPIPPFSLQVIAMGHLLLESMPTQQTKTVDSSMHNDEICSVCVGTRAPAAEADAIREQQLRRMQSGSSS